MEGIPTSIRQKAKMPFLSLDTSIGFANTAVGSLSLETIVGSSFNTVSARERFLSTPGTKIRPLALPRFYSILPAKPTLLLGWTPF